MKNPVVVIGIDSADPILLERWMAQGHLKNLQRLRETGSYGRLSNTVSYQDTAEKFMTTEPLWVTFLTGCLPNKTGYWKTVEYCKDTYSVFHDRVNGTYDYQEYPPFYTFAGKNRSAIFDVPATVLCEEVNGIQVLGWGGHLPFTPSHSNPPELFSELIQRHGEDLIYGNDNGIWWDKAYYKRIQNDLKIAISQRKSICFDLLSRENWDLFMTVFSESHTVGHDLYGFSEEDHPLYKFLKKKIPNSNPMLETLEQIDLAIGEILKKVPNNANVICFSIHGMCANYTDMLSMTFLPELLYRFSFPGFAAIGFNDSGVAPKSVIKNPFRHSWLGEIWAHNYGKNPIARMLRPLLPPQLLSRDDNGLTCPFRLNC